MVRISVSGFYSAESNGNLTFGTLSEWTTATYQRQLSVCFRSEIIPKTMLRSMCLIIESSSLEEKIEEATIQCRRSSIAAHRDPIACSALLPSFLPGPVINLLQFKCVLKGYFQICLSCSLARSFSIKITNL